MLVYQAGMLSSESPETIIPRENSEGKDQMDPRNLMNFHHLMLQDVTCNKWIFDDICILVVSTWMDGRRIYTQTPGEQIDFISQ